MKVYKLANVLTQQVPGADGGGVSDEYISIAVCNHADEFSIPTQLSLSESDFTEGELETLNAAVDLIKTKLLS